MAPQRSKRLVTAAVLAGAAVLLAGCGRGSDHTPDLHGLPLVSGAKIVTQVRTCDPGANAYCAYELVVNDPRYPNADEFLNGERKMLRQSGWTGANPPNGDESAADSPGHKLHVTFATAYGDLSGISNGWIKRTPLTARTLSHAYFAHSATLSMLLEFGAS